MALRLPAVHNHAPPVQLHHVWRPRLTTRSSATFQQHTVKPEFAQPVPERTILLAVDDGVESRYALRWAVEHLHRPGVLRPLPVNTLTPPFPCVPGLPITQPLIKQATPAHLGPSMTVPRGAPHPSHLTTCCVSLHVPPAGDTFKLVHCVPALPPGKLVAVQGAGLLRMPRVDPTLLVEKAAAEADNTLTQFKEHLTASGVSDEHQPGEVV